MINPEVRRAITRSLPPAQAAVFGGLQFGRDVQIEALYRRLPESRGLKPRTLLREKHMRVGATIWRINKKLKEHGLYIRPGIKRQTYRLVLAPRG